MFVKVAAVVALLLWFSFIGIFFYYDMTRPTLADSSVGRIYPWNNHGHIVYLTGNEQDLLYGLVLAATMLIAIAAAAGYYTKSGWDGWRR
jgi:hypothetical protein